MYQIFKFTIPTRAAKAKFSSSTIIYYWRTKCQAFAHGVKDTHYTIGNWMSARRDYGVFSKAAVRELLPLIAPLRFRHLTDTAFGRDRNSWIEGFFLQKSRSGDCFWVEAGLYVPKLESFWLRDNSPKNYGIVVGARLDDRGIHHGAESYPCENVIELNASIEKVAKNLDAAETWFAKFQSIADIAAEYKRHNRGPLALINYGFLLLLAGQINEGKEKLRAAHEQWSKIISEHEHGFQRRPPGKDALQYYELDLQRLKVIEAALNENA